MYHRLIVLVVLLAATAQSRPQEQEDQVDQVEEQQQRQSRQQALSPVQQIIASRLEATPFRLGPGLNQLSNRLYSAVATQRNGNVVLSPFSVHTALSMVYFGSPEESETHREMTELLGLPTDFYGDYAYNYLRMLLRYDNLRREFKTDVQFANKLYLDESFELKNTFNELMEIFFLTTAERVNFSQSKKAADKINNFVEQKTNGIIKDLVGQDQLSSLTRMIIVNAIYFKATWKQQFNTKNTRQATWSIPGVQSFAPIKRDFMNTQGEFGIARVPEIKSSVLELSYVDEDFRMLIVLPDVGVDVRDVDRRLGNGRFNLANVDRRLVYAPARIRLPKFSASMSASLSPALQQLGVKTLFHAGLANLTDISNGEEELYVSDVAHKAKVVVNEEGAEAAAATAAIIGTRTVSVSPKLRDFRANRPFLFIIQDKRLDVPLFIGRIVDPEGKINLPERNVRGREAENEEDGQNKRRTAALIRQPSSSSIIGARQQDVPESTEELPICDEVAGGFISVDDPQSVRFPCRQRVNTQEADSEDRSY